MAADIYEVFFWVDSFQFSNYGSPGAAEIRLRSGESVDLNSGTGPFASVLIDNPAGGKALTFATLDSKIKGTAKAGAGDAAAPMANIDVFAWSHQGGWADTRTDANGNYSMYVTAGKWEVVAEPGFNSAYGPQPPKRIKVTKGQDSTVDFVFQSAGHTVKGTVRDSNGNPVSSLWAWAYARTDNDGFDVVTDAPVDGGEFTLKLASGDYKVGLWIGPESGYSMSAEADADLSNKGNESTSTVNITVGSNDKKITGSLVDSSGKTVMGIAGDVFAVKGGARGSTWVGATINEETGKYTLSLTSGAWDLGYYLELDSDDGDYSPFPNVAQSDALSG
ncbi:MAG: carboxypeptidase-like regulatory domain-containing protein, partial [Pseudomonadales bacterium]|nr:carboxypeptidase-like regulatory domain-containing protein [Pseudomonadales bacterium]